MNPHANMPHLQNQPNASHITSPNSPPSNRWMTNVVGNNGKFEISIVVVVKDGKIILYQLWYIENTFISIFWQHDYISIPPSFVSFNPNIIPQII